jgi:hypothetical protein
LDFFTIYSAFNTLLLSKLLYPGSTNLQALLQAFSKKGLSANFLEKSLIKNWHGGVIDRRNSFRMPFGFENLIPKPSGAIDRCGSRGTAVELKRFILTGVGGIFSMILMYRGYVN